MTFYNIRIELTETSLERNPDTKTTYITKSEKTEVITQQQYYNITNNDTIKFFRRLGGSEYIERGYFSCGYGIYRIVSTSPDKQSKTVREFEFKEDKRYK
tara:strand:- start:51 stop:350 length:300 start_codon:yes stop_codon:yes gene_type:complete